MNGSTKLFSALEEASKAVNGARQENYGHPLDNFQQIASLWNNYLKGRHIEIQDVGVMMILLKCARLSHTTFHEDSLTDIAGYAETLAMIKNRLDLMDISKQTPQVNGTYNR